MPEQPQSTEIVRWYTLARRFPQLIGRTPDGAKLWGGPYTITQAVGGGLVLFVGINTMGLWARWGFFGNAVVLLSVFVGVVVGLGRIPVGSRNPIAMCAGAWRATTSPAFGRVAGKPLRPRKPRRLRHRIAIAHQVTAAAAAEPTRPVAGAQPRRQAPAPATSRPQTATPQPGATAAPQPRKPALTGVQALLAGNQINRSEHTR